MPHIQLTYSGDRVYSRIGVKRMPQELRRLGTYQPVGWIFPITYETAVALLNLHIKHRWTMSRKCKGVLMRVLPELQQGRDEVGSKIYLSGLKTEPRGYQWRLYKDMMARQGCCVDLLPGRGKTLLTMMAINSLPRGPVLLVVPYNIINEWEDQWREHFEEAYVPQFTVLSQSTMKAKVNAFLRFMELPTEHSHKVCVVNYESVWREPLSTYIKQMTWEVVVWDECHRLQSASSKVSWFAKALRRCCKYAWGLSGTLMPNGFLSLYGTARAINPMIFGTNVQAYKYRYGVWMTHGEHNEKCIELVNQHEFAVKLNQLRITANVTDEDLGLPERTDIVKRFTLSPAEQKVYYDMLKKYIAWVDGNPAVAANAVVKLLRCMQITSGFVTVGEKPQQSIQPVGKAKADYLRDLISDLPPDEPVVVYYRFKPSALNIRTVAQSLGRDYYEVSGSSNQVKDWARASGGRILGAQLRSASEGLNDLVEARYAVYFELTYSLREWIQSGGRLHRPGQRRNVVYYLLVARGTVEEKIIEAIQGKKDLVNEIYALAEDIRKNILENGIAPR